MEPSRQAPFGDLGHCAARPPTSAIPCSKDSVALPSHTRSSSSPCLRSSSETSTLTSDCPTLTADPDYDADHPHSELIRRSNSIAIVGGRSVDTERSDHLIHQIESGFLAGHALQLQKEGLGGAYLLRDASGNPLAVWKPREEEAFAPENPKNFIGRNIGDEGYGGSIRVGEACQREVAAYVIDSASGLRLANVPMTLMATMRSAGWPGHSEQQNGGTRFKTGSLQAFVTNDGDCSELGTSIFPATSIKRIGLLDLVIYNTDRHTMNMLVAMPKTGDSDFKEAARSMNIIPIDHGNALPEKMEAPFLEWLHWPQARIPFEEDEIEWVKQLDYVMLQQKLRSEVPGLRTGSLRLLWVTVTVVREAVLKYKLTLSQIGQLFTRPLSGKSETNSPLELACSQAIEDATQACAPNALSSADDSDELTDSLQFALDEETASADSIDTTWSKSQYDSMSGDSAVPPVHLPSSPPMAAASYTGESMMPRPLCITELSGEPDKPGEGAEYKVITIDFTVLSEQQWHAFQEAFAQVHLPECLRSSLSNEEHTGAQSVFGTSCPVGWSKRGSGLA